MELKLTSENIKYKIDEINEIINNIIKQTPNDSILFKIKVYYKFKYKINNPIIDIRTILFDHSFNKYIYQPSFNNSLCVFNDKNCKYCSRWYIYKHMFNQLINELLLSNSKLDMDSFAEYIYLIYPIILIQKDYHEFFTILNKL